MKFLLLITFFTGITVFISCDNITNIEPEQIDGFRVHLDKKTINNNHHLLFVVNHKVVPDSLFGRINPAHIDSIAVSKDSESINRYSSDNYHGLVEIFGNDKILTDLMPNSSKYTQDN
jgi:hypothetical protein